MRDKLNWGILGNAMIGRKCVMPAITRSRNCCIRALGTLRPHQAGDVVKANSIELLYESYDMVLQDPDIDAVYIPLPNRLHLPWTLKALAAGKHVLCEKPLACSAAEARQLQAAAHANGCVLMEALMYRFHPRTHRVKSLISDGAIGVPRLVRTAFCFSMAEELLKNGKNHRLESRQGGGALMDVGCYGVSVARWFLQAEPLMAQAQAIFRPENNVDIHLVGSLRFATRALATIEASFCSGLQQTYSIVGSNGVIDLPQDAFVPWEKDAVICYRRGAEETAEHIVVPGVDEYRLMIEHFGDLVLSGVKPLVPLEDSINNMAVLDALSEAAKTGGSVAVDLSRPRTVGMP
jgi:D-xylose 1-dehydrogenase (NADP+, D-xylono-1,5-lactone-forming)